MKNSSVKQGNRSSILSAIMAHQPISRKEISELLGISPAAVSNIADELISEDLVVEGAFGEASIRGGRRPIYLCVHKEAGLVLTGTFQLSNAWISVCNLMGEELFSRSYQDHTFGSAEDLFLTLSEECTALIQRAGGKERFVGATFSVPGIVKDDRILYSPELKLTDYDLPSRLQEILKIPVYIDKDVYLKAMGENWMGAGCEYSDFIVVTVGTGIGSAIIINNKIYRGHCGMAGEIGYVITGSDALERDPYTLTDFGYFEENSSLRALAAQSGQSFRHTVASAQAGDRAALDLLYRNADQLCLGLSSAISLINPQAVIFHGNYAASESLLADYITEHLHRLTPVPCDVKFSKLGERSLSYGCVATVWQKKYFMQFLPRN